MKIIGNLDLELARHYAELLDENVLDEEIGSNYAVAFTGAHAIKYPIEKDYTEWGEYRESLVNEYNCGIRAKEIGLSVPEMHGVNISENELPFLVMQRLNIVKPKEVFGNERKEARKQFIEQIALAKRNGLIPSDICCEVQNSGINSHDANWGWNRKQSELYLIDFSDWRIK